MSDLIWLSEAQMRRIEPYFPLSHGVPKVDDQRIISGIIFVIRNWLRWRDAPVEYGPPKTIYNQFIRWSRIGVFNKIFAGLALLRRGGRVRIGAERSGWALARLREGVAQICPPVVEPERAPPPCWCFALISFLPTKTTAAAKKSFLIMTQSLSLLFQCPASTPCARSCSLEHLEKRPSLFHLRAK